MTQLCGLDQETGQAGPGTSAEKHGGQGFTAPWGWPGPGRSGKWRFLGMLPLYDPPREDSAETIAEAQEPRE